MARGGIRQGIKVLITSLVLLMAMLPGAASAQWTQLGSDIDGEAADDRSGWSVSLSADGTRVAVGAPENDGTGDGSGHVRVYEWGGTAWVQLGADIDGEYSGDESGVSVSLSADGTRVAIGARYNDGNGNESGHVRVYSWQSPFWTQLGSDLDGEAADDSSGTSVSLSADGTRVAIGAPHNDGNASGSGHVRVYQYNGFPFFDWFQVGQDIDGEAVGDWSGASVSLAADGSFVAVGATGWGENQTGQMRVYSLQSGSWVQLGQGICGDDWYDELGRAVALSADGTRVAVGAPEISGIDDSPGYVRVYEYKGFPIEGWIRVGSDIDGEGTVDNSGNSVSLSADGTRVAIGAPLNGSDGVRPGHVRIFSAALFADGFESGNTTAWSLTAP